MRRTILSVCLAFLLTLPTGSGLNAQRRHSGAHSEASVRAYLANRLADNRADFTDACYALAWVDLNGDGRNEAVVRIMGPGVCGSGGCNMYVLSPWGRRWSLVGRMTVTQLPIRVLNTRSNGWRDLGVRLRLLRNDHFERLEGLLPFDGRIYSSNPYMPPSRRLRRIVPGRILISDADRGRALF